MYIMKVSSDGNCLVRAIGLQTGQTHQQLREALFLEYMNHYTYYMPFINNLDEYAYKIRRDKAWLDETDIAALANATESIIEVYTDKYCQLLHPYMLYTGRVVTRTEPVRVFYVNGNHYDAVITQVNNFSIINEATSDGETNLYCNNNRCWRRNITSCQKCEQKFCSSCIENHECETYK